MMSKILWVSVFVLYCLIVQLIGIAIFLQAISIIVVNLIAQHGGVP
jgi:hypothetical protein